MSVEEQPPGPPAAIALEPIGVVRSPYGIRHGTPQQATAGETREARLELFPDRVPAAALDDLEGIERLWVVAFLHRSSSWSPKVMPPRGPRVKRGVFATRSPHRPNAIGLSCVRLVRVEGHSIVVDGIDLLDGTPILDLKPYLPYADAFPEAAIGWIADVPPGSPQIGRGPRRKHRLAPDETDETDDTGET